MTDSLEARIRRMEDHNQISECVSRYAMALDNCDWDLFKDTIAEQGFTIDNPNAAGSCACGDSFH